MATDHTETVDLLQSYRLGVDNARLPQMSGRWVIEIEEIVGKKQNPTTFAKYPDSPENKNVLPRLSSNYNSIFDYILVD